MLIEEQNGNFAKPVLPAVPSSEVYLEDCVKALKRFNDKHFDLAIVDPPYDFSISKTSFVAKGEHNKNKRQRFGGAKDKGGFVISSKHESSLQFAPSKEYFDELFRVSKNQIVWGANYMTEHLPPKMGWIVWDKGQRDFSLADGELAWTSFDKAMRIFTYARAKALKEGKIHPTQKPTDLYKWLLDKYAKQGDKILDTHLGSGSIAIACWDMGYDLTAYEVDKEYFDNACKRLETHKAQLTLW